MTAMRLSLCLAMIFIITGAMFSLSDGGTIESVVQLGHTLIVSGAIMLAGLLISITIHKNNFK